MVEWDGSKYKIKIKRMIGRGRGGRRRKRRRMRMMKRNTKIIDGGSMRQVEE